MAAVKRRWSAVPGMAIVVIVILGCDSKSTRPNPRSESSIRGSRPSTQADKEPAPAAATKPGMLVGTPAVTLTAEEFGKAAREEANYLIAKHAGQLVEVTGLVESVKRDFGGDPILLLNASPKGGYELINCPLADRNHWSKVFIGQTVTLRGRAPTSATDPVPFVWHIHAVAGPEPAKLTVEAFVKEVLADPEATQEKYKGKPILLTGEVAEPKLHEGNLVGVVLRLAEKEPVVVCYATGVGGEEETNFVRGVAKPGQKVTMAVEYDGYYEGTISLRGPIIDPAY